jgi:hypothetical protein
MKKMGNDKESASNNVSASARIWNPEAVANWSLFLTPIFGAYLQAVNWRELGFADKSKSSLNWLYVSIILFLALPPISAYLYVTAGGLDAGFLIALLYLFVWYFSFGSEQLRYTRKTLKSVYTKRSIWIPLAVSILMVIFYKIFYYQMLFLFTFAIASS